MIHNSVIKRKSAFSSFARAQDFELLVFQVLVDSGVLALLDRAERVVDVVCGCHVNVKRSAVCENAYAFVTYNNNF